MSSVMWLHIALVQCWLSGVLAAMAFILFMDGDTLLPAACAIVAGINIHLAIINAKRWQP